MGFFSALFPPATTAREAFDAAGKAEAVIIDVREKHEYKAGHAPGAKNIPMSKLAARTNELSPDRRYVAVCRSGSRSRSAVAHLRNAGIDIVNLKGGMLSWRRAGLPVVKR